MPATQTRESYSRTARAAVLPEHRFRSDIEGLRAVAVLSVVLFHVGVPFLPGGYVGVDVFFVISGFLITGLMVREVGRTDRLSLSRFYARRVRRLLPMATTVIVATLVASMFILPSGSLTSIGLAAGASATFWANWYFAAQAGDYFGADLTTNPFLHFWSLSVEEQFYLIWPLLIVGVAVLCIKRGWNHRLRRTLLTGALACVTGLSLTVSLTSEGSESSYFLLQSRLWELGFGAFVALAARPLTRLPQAVTLVASWLGIAMISWAVLRFDEETVFPGSAALVPVIGATLVIVAGMADRQSRYHACRLLSAGPMQYVGARSYNLYLWHWPVLILTTALLVPPAQVAQVGSTGSRISVIVALIALAITAVLTISSYRLIEAPLRVGLAAVTTRTTLIAGGLAIAMTVLTAIATPVLAPSAATAARNGPAQVQVECGEPNGESNEKCTFGSAQAGTRVAMIGDSHAAMWRPALNRLAEQNDWRIHYYTRPACWYAATKAGTDQASQKLQECGQANETTWQRLESRGPFDAIVIARFQAYVDALGEHGISEQSMLTQLRETLRAYSRVTSTVIILREPPRAPFDVAACMSAADGDAEECEFNRLAAVEADARFAELEQRAAKEFPNLEVQFVSTAHLFCPEDQANCSPLDAAGNAIYRDAHHISSEAVDAVRTQLEALLRKRSPHLFGEQTS